MARTDIWRKSQKQRTDSGQVVSGKVIHTFVRRQHTYSKRQHTYPRSYIKRQLSLPSLNNYAHVLENTAQLHPPASTAYKQVRAAITSCVICVSSSTSTLPLRRFRIFLAAAVRSASSAAVNSRALAFPLDFLLAKLIQSWWNKLLNNRLFNHQRNNLRSRRNHLLSPCHGTRLGAGLSY